MIRRFLLVVRPFLPIVLAVALLTVLAFRVHPAEVWDELRKADLYWIPALLAANLVSDYFRALRWQQLTPKDKRPPVFLMFFASHIGSAVNFLVPLRAGEAIRVRLISQRTGIAPAVLVATLFGEVLSDLVTFSIYIAIGLALMSEATFLWPVGVVVGVVAAGAMTGGLVLGQRGERWTGPPDTGGWKGWLGRQLYHFAKGLAPLRKPERFGVLLATAQGTWLFETLMFYMSGQALGIDLSFPAYMLLVVTANVAGSIPLTQAGFGVFELGSITGAIVLGQRGEQWKGPPETRGWKGWLGRQLYHFAQGLAPLRKPGRFGVLLATAQGTWLFETLMFYMSGQALGIDLSFPAYMLLVVTANVAGSIPLTQAGFGVFELGVAGVMRALGVPEVQAATYALFVHVLLTTPHLLYGPLAAWILQVNPSDILLFRSEKSAGAASLREE